MSKPGFAGSEVVLKSSKEVFTFLQWAEGQPSAQWGPSTRAMLLARDGTVHMHDFSDVIFCMSESESEIRDVPDTAPSEGVEGIGDLLWTHGSSGVDFGIYRADDVVAVAASLSQAVQCVELINRDIREAVNRTEQRMQRRVEELEKHNNALEEQNEELQTIEREQAARIQDLQGVQVVLSEQAKPKVTRGEVRKALDLKGFGATSPLCVDRICKLFGIEEAQ